MGQHFGSNDATSTTINIKAKKVMFLLRGCVCAQYCQQQNPGTSEGCLQIRQRAAVICHVCLINPAQRSSFFNPKEKKKKDLRQESQLLQEQWETARAIHRKLQEWVKVTSSPISVHLPPRQMGDACDLCTSPKVLGLKLGKFGAHGTG